MLEAGEDPLNSRLLVQNLRSSSLDGISGTFNFDNQGEGIRMNNIDVLNVQEALSIRVVGSAKPDVNGLLQMSLEEEAMFWVGRGDKPCGGYYLSCVFTHNSNSCSSMPL